MFQGRSNTDSGGDFFSNLRNVIVYFLGEPREAVEVSDALQLKIEKFSLVSALVYLSGKVTVEDTFENWCLQCREFFQHDAS